MRYFESTHNNFEQFADDIVAWDVDFKQLNSSPFRSLLRQTHTKQLLVTSASFSAQLEQRGEAPKNLWTFAFLQGNSPYIIWRGRTFSNQIAVYRPGSEIDAFSPSGFNVLTFSISTTEIERWADIYGLKQYNSLSFPNDILTIDKRKLSKLQDGAEQLLTSQMLSLNGDEQIENLIVDLLETVWRGRPYIERISSINRFKIFKRLISYIDEKLNETITLADLCKAENISPRTVQRLFQCYADTSPKNYIRTRKLVCVRSELLTTSCYSKKISDIANNWNFWHMGQFAQDYTKLFKELPSQTLAKAKN